MLRLETVNEKTFGQVLDMKLPEEQARFVAPNVVSLAQAWLAGAQARPYALLYGRQVVGFLMLDWDEGERTAGIWRFMVRPDFQGRGLGRQAMQEAIRLARDSGKIDLMHLSFVPGNAVAHRLYRSLGFRETGQMDGDEIVMTLPLTDAPRLGLCPADEDDLPDLLKVVGDRGLGGEERFSPEAMEAALADRALLRLTLMGETVGLAPSGNPLLLNAHKGRLAEAERLLGKA